MEVKNLPVDGSTKMPDSIMEPLGPWKMEDAVDFETAYLSGYLADKYDVDADESSKRVLERAKSSVEKRLSATIGPYMRGPGAHSDISMTGGRERYVLLPLWSRYCRRKNEEDSCIFSILSLCLLSRSNDPGGRQNRFIE